MSRRELAPPPPPLSLARCAVVWHSIDLVLSSAPSWWLGASAATAPLRKLSKLKEAERRALRRPSCVKPVKQAVKAIITIRFCELISSPLWTWSRSWVGYWVLYGPSAMLSLGRLSWWHPILLIAGRRVPSDMHCRILYKYNCTVHLSQCGLTACSRHIGKVQPSLRLHIIVFAMWNAHVLLVLWDCYNHEIYWSFCFVLFPLPFLFYQFVVFLILFFWKYEKYTS